MPLPFLINPNAPVPIFRQIADGLRASIARGTYAPGELIPSVRTLAEELGVNPNTVQKAVADVERDGLIESERGRGMVVRAGTRVQARASGDEAVLAHLGEAARVAFAAGLTQERFELLARRALKSAADNQRLVGPTVGEAQQGGHS
jgi:GntR family transcriptional regulator